MIIIYHTHVKSTVVIEFEQAVYSVKEDVGSVAVCVVATGMIGSEEITIYTENNTALGIYLTWHRGYLCDNISIALMQLM